MPSDLVTGSDRLPLPETLSAAQQSAAQAISAGPRGALFGPFVPLLRSPELMTRLQEVGAYLRFESSVSAHLRELVILVIARDWNQDFEWGHHVPLARSTGLDEAVITAVGQRGDITGDGPVQAVWRLIRELLDTREVTDATYAQVREIVGDDGVVDLVATAGYYTTLAMTMNVARTPVPADYERLPATVREK
jgi:4-carboxymuconolactone decarboxylase